MPLSATPLLTRRTNRYATLFCIFINTIVLACDRRTQSEGEIKALEVINFILTLYFALEMAIKIIGGGTWK